MTASDNLSSQLFHGTRAVIHGKAIKATGFHQEAWATDSPEAAELYGKTKLPAGKVGPLKIYTVEPVSKNLTQKVPHPFMEGVNNYVSPFGFRITGEHK